MTGDLVHFVATIAIALCAVYMWVWTVVAAFLKDTKSVLDWGLLALTPTALFVWMLYGS